MGIVTALNGFRIDLMLNGMTIGLDYNDETKRLVRVVSPYPIHQTMIGRDAMQFMSKLLTAGWKEIGRRAWSDVYM